MTDSVLPLALLLEIDTPPLSGALEHRRFIEVTKHRETTLLHPTSHPPKIAHNSTGPSSDTSDVMEARGISL
ncbi:hypothetical protein B0H34DRAFT_724065, partial [Crassisporium funariophilum]